VRRYPSRARGTPPRARPGGWRCNRDMQPIGVTGLIQRRHHPPAGLRSCSPTSSREILLSARDAPPLHSSAAPHRGAQRYPAVKGWIGVNSASRVSNAGVEYRVVSLRQKSRNAVSHMALLPLVRLAPALLALLHGANFRRCCPAALLSRKKQSTSRLLSDAFVSKL